MQDKAQVNKPKKGFLSSLFEKLKKKLEEKAKSCSCCNGKDKQGGGSCCS